MQHLNTSPADLVPRAEFELTNIIFIIQHLSILLHIQDKPTPQHIPTPNTGNQEGYHLQMDESAPLCTTRKGPPKHTLTPFYKGYDPIYNTLDMSNMPRPLELCFNFKKSSSPNVTPHWIPLLWIPLMSWQLLQSPNNTILQMHYSAHSAHHISAGMHNI